MKRKIVSKMLQVLVLMTLLIAVFLATNVTDELPDEIPENRPISKEETKVYTTGSSLYGNEESIPVAGMTAELMKMHDLDAVELADNDVSMVEESLEKLEEPKELNIKDVEYTRYATEVLNIREEPTKESKLLGRFGIGNEIRVTGEIEDCDFIRITYNGQEAYVWADSLSEDEPVVEEVEEVVEYSWGGEVLNRTNGKINGPSGEETYYNLDMSGVVRIMRSIGNTDPYWVRSDGCKMLGDYIMVAADLSIRPRGSLIPTSLGMGIVTDTGEFIYTNRYRLDIATAW